MIWHLDWPSSADIGRADQKPAISSIGRCVADRPIAHGRRGAQPIEPRERQRQMRAALVAGQGVDFVDDHRPHAAEYLAALAAGQQQVERLGRGHQNMRRLAEHRLPLARRRVARAHGDANRLPARTRPLPPPPRISSSGTCRLRWMSLLSALSGET